MPDPDMVPAAGRSFYLKLAASVLVAVMIGSVVVLVGLLALNEGEPGLDDADPGRLTETLYAWEGDVPALVDVTKTWGFGDWRNTSDREASGGAVIVDVNRDGAFDVVVAGGEAVLFLARPQGGFAAVDLDVSRTVAVEAGDLDLDGWVDIVLGRSVDGDVIVWGGPWVDGVGEPETTEVPGGQPTTGLIIARLAGRRVLPDLLRIDYGGFDRVVVQDPPRSFSDGEVLPNSDRRSLAASVADLNSDGELDIWITRDVGWQSGGDSLLLGSPGGAARDATDQYRAGLEIDGMGVTLADLNGDGSLDAYLSDLGDNEILIGSQASFRSFYDSGAARIRPPGSAGDVISSSWASGAADLNLDGILDLVVVNGGFAEPVANKVAGTRVQVSDPPALFLGLGDGRFADVWDATGIAWEGAGRGLALGDLDGDLDTDIVIVTRDRGLVVLRNDVAGPAVSVEVEPGCLATGGTVQVSAGSRSYTALLGAPSFLGRHGTQAIVGTGGDPTEVLVTFPHQGAALASVAGTGRERVVLACEGG